MCKLVEMKSTWCGLCGVVSGSFAISIETKPLRVIEQGGPRASPCEEEALSQVPNILGRRR